jgi:hypothetical protein
LDSQNYAKNSRKRQVFAHTKKLSENLRRSYD